METLYGIIWFEGDNTFTLVNDQDKTVLITESEAKNDGIQILKTEDQVNAAVDDVRYAISTELLEDLYGWTNE